MYSVYSAIFFLSLKRSILEILDAGRVTFSFTLSSDLGDKSHSCSVVKHRLLSSLRGESHWLLRASAVDSACHLPLLNVLLHFFDV